MVHGYSKRLCYPFASIDNGHHKRPILCKGLHRIRCNEPLLFYGSGEQVGQLAYQYVWSN